MRKSVITGVFACALVFAVSGDKSEAASVDKIEIKNAGIELPLVAKSDDHPLAEFSDEKNVTNDKQQTNQPKKHVVKPGDSLEKIARMYNINWKKIYDKNTTIKNPDQIKVGSTVEIPKKGEKLSERALPEPTISTSAVSSARRSTQSTQNQTTVANTTSAVQRTTSSRGSSSGNRYVAGYCTWYVKNKRPDLPNNLGNAYTWASRASAQGIGTGSTPRAGAVGQRGNHVVYVESVNSDGTVTISEMNHKGLYVRTVRTLPASYFTYIY